MTVQELVNALDKPVSVLGGILGIAGALCAAALWLWPRRVGLKRWWSERTDRRRQLAISLLTKARDFQVRRSDTQRLRLLRTAALMFSWAGDRRSHANVALRIAEARAAVLSSVRNDARALHAAVKASTLAEACAEFGAAAESEQLAGDLCYIPISQRDEAAAQGHFRRAHNFYRQAGDEENAASVLTRLEALRRTFGPKIDA
jgi:hypothetical protein